MYCYHFEQRHIIDLLYKQPNKVSRYKLLNFPSNFGTKESGVYIWLIMRHCIILCEKKNYVILIIL